MSHHRTAARREERRAIQPLALTRAAKGRLPLKSASVCRSTERPDQPMPAAIRLTAEKPPWEEKRERDERTEAVLSKSEEKRAEGRGRGQRIRKASDRVAKKVTKAARESMAVPPLTMASDRSRMPLCMGLCPFGGGKGGKGGKGVFANLFFAVRRA